MSEDKGILYPLTSGASTPFLLTLSTIGMIRANRKARSGRHSLVTEWGAGSPSAVSRSKVHNEGTCNRFHALLGTKPAARQDVTICHYNYGVVLTRLIIGLSEAIDQDAASMQPATRLLGTAKETRKGRIPSSTHT